MIGPLAGFDSADCIEGSSISRGLQPVLFVSHGAPDLLFSNHPAAEALRALGASLPKPAAILCLSPHWQTQLPTFDKSAQPKTLHDFSGFDPRLQQFRYSAPGAPELASSLQNRLLGLGVSSRLQQRGLDHGAWVALALMFPQADIPVLQCSLPLGLKPAQYFSLGQHFKSLGDENILIVVTGGSVHNLRYMAPEGSAVPGWAQDFQAWLVEQLRSGQHERLMRWRDQAPNASIAHPTTEHLDGLWVALGAAKKAVPAVIYQGFSYGSLGLLHLRFD